MEKIYSKIDPEKLLHFVVRKQDILPGRQDVVSEEHFLQCSILNMKEGKTFKPHKHIWKERTRNVVPRKKRGLPDTATLRSANRCASRLATGRQ